ncbi:hypothetical protein P3T23_008912 [Paraburkholderia sp. GAS448]|uniref:peptidase C39 n=1 Tax=Paraburkholderia sp. GAS448 TaxID=3035136 RepID=UPI003D22FAFF
MKRHLSAWGLALCSTMCGCCSGVLAAENAGLPPVPELLSSAGIASQAIQVQTVDDEVLAHQTGKYAGASMISGFVLNLLSEWQQPNGAMAIAQGTLTVVQGASGQISATVDTHAGVTGDAGAGSGASRNAHVSGGQGVAVNGISQVTQVAGDGNLGTNAAQIDFNNNAALLPAGANGAPSATASSLTGSITASVAFGAHGMSVALQTPAGAATQTIAPGNAQIAQLLQIAGNQQQVTNQLQLHLQTQPISAAMLRQMGLLQALQNIVRR